MRKGQWKTMESIIAGVIILLFVAGMGATGMQASPPEPVQGHRALGDLYESGSLREHAPARNCSAIDALVTATGYIIGYDHSVRVCDEGGSCCGQVPGSENVWVSSLVMAGDEDYEPVEVMLYLTRD